MFKFKVYKIDDINTWNEVIKGFKQYDIYYIANYTKAFQFHGDGEPMLFYYEDEKIKAINVVMKRDIEKDVNFKEKIEPETYFDITTPYGYGGFIVEGTINDTSLHQLNEAYSEYCASNNIISEFVRFHPVLQNAKINEGIYDVINLGNTITIELM